MEQFGHEVEDAAKRWSRDPAVKGDLTFLGRLWGLVLLAAGLWLFADVTIGLGMPQVPLSDLWPVALIVLGGIVVVRGAARRT